MALARAAIPMMILLPYRGASIPNTKADAIAIREVTVISPPAWKWDKPSPSSMEGKHQAVGHPG